LRALAAIAILSAPALTFAFPAHLRRVEALYGIADADNADCGLCHTAGGGSPRNPFGTAFQVAGANETALRTIEERDSDRDGASNVAEILAGYFPGDPGSTPSDEEASEALSSRGAPDASADELPDVDAAAGEFALAVPDEALGQGLAASGGGPGLTYTIGGAIDLRVVVPTDARGNPARAIDGFVHVAEVVVQTTIEQRVTLLGEVLLPLNADQPLEGQFLGNDHGFYYVTVADVPYPTASLWLGRYRIPYGVDAVLDGASNPLPTPVYRSIGRISDLAIMVKGYAAMFEYSLAATDGVGVLPAPETDPEAEDELVDDWPIFGRVAADLSDLLPGLHLGASGYYGRALRESAVGHAAHGAGSSGLLARKWRGALSAWYVAGRLGIHLEGEAGQDELEVQDLIAWREETSRHDFEAFETLSIFGRATYRIWEPFDVAVQGHYYDPNRNRENVDDSSEEELSAGAAATWRAADQLRLRLAWLGYFMDDADRIDVATAQFLVEF